MKYLIALLFLFIIKNTNAQMSRDSVELKIINFPDTVAKMKSGAIKINAMLINHSDFYSLIIPGTNGKLNAFAKETNPLIYYEIIYSGSHGEDTLFKKVLPMDINPIKMSNSLLYSHESKEIVCTPDPYYFKKNGLYKIRIGFRASSLNRCYEDVSTNWISIYIKDPNLGK